MNATAELRRSIHLVLTIVAVAIAAAKVIGVENVLEPSRYASPTPDGFNADRPDAPSRAWPSTRPEPTPMFGSNDRSRWATVRALVDNGEFKIGHRDNWKSETDHPDHGIIFEDGWKTIDIVMNPATGEYYSSKPPLFAVLLAAEYWAIKHAIGWDIVKDRWYVIVTISSYC